MPKNLRALLVAAMAAGIAAIGWHRLSNRGRRKARLDSARAEFSRGEAMSREEEIESLTAEQRVQMLRELSNQV